MCVFFLHHLVCGGLDKDISQEKVKTTISGIDFNLKKTAIKSFGKLLLQWGEKPDENHSLYIIIIIIFIIHRDILSEAGESQLEVCKAAKRSKDETLIISISPDVFRGGRRETRKGGKIQLKAQEIQHVA